MKRSKLVAPLALAWLATFAWVAHAATTYAQESRSYDWESLAWAAGTGFLGATLNTLLTLATDKRAVLVILAEARKDAVVGIIGGVVAYVLVQGLASTGWFTVQKDLRVLIIGGVGFSRGAWRGLIRRGAIAAETGINNKLRMGASAADDKISSVIAPLEDK